MFAALFSEGKKGSKQQASWLTCGQERMDGQRGVFIRNESEACVCYTIMAGALDSDWRIICWGKKLEACPHCTRTTYYYRSSGRDIRTKSDDIWVR